MLTLNWSKQWVDFISSWVQCYQHFDMNQTRQWADISPHWYSVPTLWGEPDKAVSGHIPSLVQCTNLVKWTRQGSERTYLLTGTLYQCCDVNQTRQWADIISSLVQCTDVMRWTRQGITSSLVQCAHVNIKWTHQWAHVMSSPVQCATNDYSADSQQMRGAWKLAVLRQAALVSGCLSLLQCAEVWPWSSYNIVDIHSECDGGVVSKQ